MSRQGLYDAIFELVLMARLIDQHGEFGGLYEKADELLDAAIYQITEALLFVHESGGVTSPLIVAERDGARLVVHFDLIHIDEAGLETVLDDGVRADYRLEGELGSIVVAGHEYHWPEIVDGLRGALTAEENNAIDGELVCAEVLRS